MVAVKRVAVFDDDDDLLIIFRFFFEEKGWEVHTYKTSDDVIDKVRMSSPDVILMDNWIPTTGGLFATQMLKNDEELKNIPVIYISANNDIKGIAERAGADTYVAKPFDFEHLQNVVDSFF
ncbi:response regulator [Taibaiella lutea]|uniref:Response regulator n=1 Tax=Taibaiella lutea TaxID=2608001 RepID=A0A5M6CUU0_9BACT|nr:response regulator [Taibaiella lutea]KAA5536959.1 response regulator [Taibaiella lutea]